MVARCLLRAVLVSPLLGGSAALLGAGAATATPVAAQAAPSSRPAWNDARALELVDRARALRQSATVDQAFRTYQAEARGYVYFFVDRPDRAEHVLVKADQVALDLYWRAPNSTKQRIVGQRDEKVLPTSIRYHLDHLTVVQDDFGDLIRLGDGDEVAAVTHPVAPGSDRVYDFQLVDSLSLSYGSDGREVRVYELQVRPKEMDRPGYVGTIFLDRSTGAVVRMNFSFTPASYVDAYLDYIRISLDNSLWLGRYWLPYRQEVEIRREMPVLDFSAGSVIRTRFDIGAYDFNVELDRTLFNGSGVSAVSLSQRQAFPFERGLFDEIDEEGLTVSTTMEEVRAQVREVVQDEVLSGLAPVRLHLDGISDFARYDRAEGVYVGGGVTLRPGGDLRARWLAGYAFGRDGVSSTLALGRDGPSSVGAELYWDDVADIGGNPGATPLVNTISAASGDTDYLDPFLRRGATLTLGSGRPVALALQWERHASARDVVSSGDRQFRPVRSVDEGTLVAAGLSLGLRAPGNGLASLTARGGRLGSRNLLGATGGLRWKLGNGREGWSADASVRGGIVNPHAPVQEIFLVGGRATLPGHDYRAFAGNGYWLSRVAVTVPVRRPYLSVRLLGGVGATYLRGVDPPADWTIVDSDGLRGSVGVGLSIGWDSVYFDVSHGVRGGGWEAVFSVSEDFEGWM